MPPVCSFIIPVLNEEAGIASVLGRLRAEFPEAECLVVDGGSRDHTVARAMPYASQLLVGPPGRAVQMNLAARAARGTYLLFLHADSYPVFSATDLALQLADNPPWGFCRARLSGGQAAFRVIEAAMNLRSRITRVATGDQLIFVHRDLFHQLHGFREIPLMEDVELSKRLRAHSAPRILAGWVQTSSRRWEEGGIAATVLRMWCLRLAYFCGVSPQRLWRHYYGR